MDIQAQKIQLMKRLLETEDINILSQIWGIFENKNQKADFWDELHDDVKANMEDAIAELGRGEGIAHSVVVKKHEKWLKK